MSLSFEKNLAYHSHVVHDITGHVHTQLLSNLVFIWCGLSNQLDKKCVWENSQQISIHHIYHIGAAYGTLGNTHTGLIAFHHGKPK